MPSPHYTTAKREGPDLKTWPFSFADHPLLNRRQPKETDAGGDLDQV
jgi:hypothetical protein